jgi:hypothetical protein
VEILRRHPFDLSAEILELFLGARDLLAQALVNLDGDERANE